MFLTHLLHPWHSAGLCWKAADRHRRALFQAQLPVVPRGKNQSSVFWAQWWRNAEAAAADAPMGAWGGTCLPEDSTLSLAISSCLLLLTPITAPWLLLGHGPATQRDWGPGSHSPWVCSRPTGCLTGTPCLFPLHSANPLAARWILFKHTPLSPCTAQTLWRPFRYKLLSWHSGRVSLI